DGHSRCSMFAPCGRASTATCAGGDSMIVTIRLFVLVALAASLGAVACAGSAQNEPARPQPSYAVYTEYAMDSNKLMKGGLNRRVFNKTEAQAGSDIALNGDGSISLQP